MVLLHEDFGDCDIIVEESGHLAGVIMMILHALLLDTITRLEGLDEEFYRRNGVATSLHDTGLDEGSL